MSNFSRVIAILIVAVFLISSSIVTIAFLYDEMKGDDQTTNSSQEEAQVDDANKLEGKQLDNFTPGEAIPELKIIDTVPGSGSAVKAGETVTVDYTGAVAATGIIFQSSKDTGQPVSFPLDQVIAGWSQGIPGMKEGGTRRLLIPANLAYGASPPPNSNIPANADLVFDVILHKIGQ